MALGLMFAGVILKTISWLKYFSANNTIFSS